MQHTEHDHEELFQKNPHPELFDEDGNLDRGDYTTITFDPGFDPDNWDPLTDIMLDGEDEWCYNSIRVQGVSPLKTWSS